MVLPSPSFPGSGLWCCTVELTGRVCASWDLHFVPSSTCPSCWTRVVIWSAAGVVGLQEAAAVLALTLCSDSETFVESQNYGMVWVGTTLKDHLAPAIAGIFSSKPGRSKPCPTWPWTLAGLENSCEHKLTICRAFS